MLLILVNNMHNKSVRFRSLHLILRGSGQPNLFKFTHGKLTLIRERA